MDTPNKNDKILPKLTPKNPDGSQRVIKQIMVIDPNKLRSAGLDLKMAEALKKSKVRASTNSPVVRTKDEKLAMAKSILNKKLKEAQMSRESAKHAILSQGAAGEGRLKKLLFSSTAKGAVTKPQITVATMKSLMPPPSTPISPAPNKSCTMLLNFVNCDEKASSIEVNIMDTSLRPPKKARPDTIPKASIKSSTESRTISPGVRFEIKRKLESSIEAEETSFKVLPNVLPPVKKDNLRPRYTPVQEQPTAIVSKVLPPPVPVAKDVSRSFQQPASKELTSATQKLQATASESITQDNESPKAKPCPRRHFSQDTAQSPPKQFPTIIECKILTHQTKEEVKDKYMSPQKNLPEVIESKVLTPEEKIDLSTLCVKSSTKLLPGTTPLSVCQRPDNLASSKIEEANIEIKKIKASPQKNTIVKPVFEESAVDFINSLHFMRDTGLNVSTSKSELQEEAITTGEDATSFLMSLFGQQAAKSTVIFPPLEPTESISAEVETTDQPKKSQQTKLTCTKEFDLTSRSIGSVRDREITPTVSIKEYKSGYSIDGCSSMDESNLKSRGISGDVKSSADNNLLELPSNVSIKASSKHEIEHLTSTVKDQSLNADRVSPKANEEETTTKISKISAEKPPQNLLENEAKEEDTSSSISTPTVSTRRKGKKKSVPVMISILHKNRKSTNQVKPVNEPCAKNVPADASVVSTKTSTSQKGSYEDNITSKLSPTVKTSELIEQLSVEIAPEKSLRRRKNTSNDKNPSESSSITSTDQEKPAIGEKNSDKQSAVPNLSKEVKEKALEAKDESSIPIDNRISVIRPTTSKDLETSQDPTISHRYTIRNQRSVTQTSGNHETTEEIDNNKELQGFQAQNQSPNKDHDKHIQPQSSDDQRSLVKCATPKRNARQATAPEGLTAKALALEEKEESQGVTISPDLIYQTPVQDTELPATPKEKEMELKESPIKLHQSEIKIPSSPTLKQGIELKESEIKTPLSPVLTQENPNPVNPPKVKETNKEGKCDVSTPQRTRGSRGKSNTTANSTRKSKEIISEEKLSQNESDEGVAKGSTITKPMTRRSTHSQIAKLELNTQTVEELPYSTQPTVVLSSSAKEDTPNCAAPNLKINDESMSDMSDNVPSTSRARRSIKNKKADETLTIESTTNTSEESERLTDGTVSDATLDEVLGGSRSSRCRKKTAKFEEYSKGVKKVTEKTSPRKADSATSQLKSGETSEASPSESPLFRSNAVQPKGRRKLTKGVVNLVNRKKTDPSKVLENKSIPENIVTTSEKPSSPIEDSLDASDVFDRFDDSDFDSSSAVMDFSTAAEGTVQNDSLQVEICIEQSVSAVEEINPKQGKAKNPFRKAKPDEKEGKVSPNDEPDFHGFHEREIKEGQQSTTLRISQSTDVAPVQLHSPLVQLQSPLVQLQSEPIELQPPPVQRDELPIELPSPPVQGDERPVQVTSPPASGREKTDSPGVKKDALSAGKKQKADKKQWKKNSAVSLKNWLKKVDTNSEAASEPEKQQEANTGKKSLQEVEKAKEEKEIIPEMNPPNPPKKDDVKTLQGIKKAKGKKEVEEVIPEVNPSHSPKKKDTKPLHVSGKTKRRKGDEEVISEPASIVVQEQIPETPKKRGKTKTKRASTATCNSKCEDDEQLEECTQSESNTYSKSKTEKVSPKTQKKTKRTEKNTPKTDDDRKPLDESSDLVESSILENKGSLQAPAKLEKKKPKKRTSISGIEGHPIEQIDDIKTPTKLPSRKRKRADIEESTPTIEPPNKILLMSPVNDNKFISPTPKRGGRQKVCVNEPPRKSTYIPVVPVSPLEKKYKNDTEFNPRLLLIRQKEDLKTDAQLIDPDMQTVPKNKDDVQCALCMGYAAKKKWLQHVSGHYGVGWIVGNPPPLNVKSRASVLNFMVEFFKTSKVKGLNCRLCQAQRRSALGLLVHLEQCCLTEEELKDTRVECEHCNNNYSKSSIIIHLRSCSVLLKKLLAEKQEAEIPVDEEVKEDVLSNTGRLKRKSVIKAENKFKNMDDVIFIADELIKHIPSQRIDTFPSTWQREIQHFGKGFCVQKKCPFTATTVEELQQHCQDGICSFYIKPGYLCKRCKFHGENLETVRSHVIEHHKPRPLKGLGDSDDDAEIDSQSSSESASSGDEEVDTAEGSGKEGENDEQNKPKRKKKSKTKIKTNRVKPLKNSPTKDFKKLLPDRDPNIAAQVAKWFEIFINENYSSEPLFPFATAEVISMKGDDYEPYFPKSPVSMKFLLRGFNGFVKEFGKTHVEPNQWQHLDRFKGTGQESEHAIYLGGPVKTIAWVPLEPSPPSSTQYIAVITRKGIDKFTRFLQPKQSRSLVYIVKYITGSDELRGEIQYALAIDQGPIHCIEFLPSGGYAPDMNRLGLLAVGTVETEIKIYSLPIEVEKRNCDIFPIIRLKPAFELCLELVQSPSEFSDEYQSQCIELVWSQAAGHNFIVGGYLNGFVAIWDISDEEDNLNRFLMNDSRRFVPVSYFWSLDNQIQLALHYDVNGLRWLAVYNSSRKLVIYDVREITKPVVVYVDTTKNVCNSINWPIVWENLFCGIGDSLPSHGSVLNAVSPMSLVFINRRLDKFCCGVNDIDFNIWRNVYAAGAENGDIHVVSIREAVLDVGLRTKIDEKIISTLDIMTFDGDGTQKPPDEWRLFETDYNNKYGLVFGSVQRIIGAKKPQLYSVKRIPPLSLSRLMRVNRLRFNPNRNANSFLAIGYDNGFLRVIHNDWHTTSKETQS